MQSNLFADGTVPAVPARGSPTAVAHAPEPVAKQPLANSSQYATGLRCTQIAPLSPFPEFHFTIAKLDENFDLRLKPRTAVSERPLRRLSFTPGAQLKELRVALDKDLADFADRMKRLGTAQPIKMETVQFPEQAAAPKPLPKAKKQKGAQAPKDDEPRFTTDSQFIMPDGADFD
jgi:hypothetical protein